MLTDAELDERESLVHAYDDTLHQLQFWPDSWHLSELRRRQEGRLALIVEPLIADLRSARATIAEMRGRLERALGSVDAVLHGAEVTGGRTEGEP